MKWWLLSSRSAYCWGHLFWKVAWEKDPLWWGDDFRRLPIVETNTMGEVRLSDGEWGEQSIRGHNYDYGNEKQVTR